MYNKSLQHAQHRIGCEFTKEEFLAGKVGDLMIPEDFRPEETVSNTFINLPTYTPLLDVICICCQLATFNSHQFVLSIPETCAFTTSFQLPLILFEVSFTHFKLA